MGIHSRDYIRDDESPYGRYMASTEAWKVLLIITVVVFVLQLVSRTERIRPDGLIERTSVAAEWLALDPVKVMHGQVWRFVTYAFCHETGGGLPLHILFNMLFLWWFGKTLESMYGSREFVLFYLTSAAVAGVAFVGLSIILDDPTPAMGASGAVMALLMVYAMHFPRQMIYIMGIIPVEIRWLVAAYVVFDLWPIMNQLAGVAGAEDGIAHSAHLGGLAFGFAYKQCGWRLSTLFSGWKTPSFDRLVGRKSKIRIYKPSVAVPEENLDDQVDAILEKISRTGESSLSEREREVLKTASQRYKNR